MYNKMVLVKEVLKVADIHWHMLWRW